ncbi:unnamed protein product, partial [Alternaria alternata]
FSRNSGKNEADEEVSPQLQGPTRTVGYLQALPPELIDLILEYAEWPLRIDPKLGMEVFLADTQNAEELPRDRVLEFLQKIDTRLAVRYLEHIIEELNDLNWEFDNDEEKMDWKHRLEVFLKKGMRSTIGIGSFSSCLGMVCVIISDKKEDHNPDYYEARAIVLSKMGSHKQALAIYVFQLKDYQKAEEYCNQVYTAPPTTPTSPNLSHSQSPPATRGSIEDTELSIYHVLLSLYLQPPPPHQPNWPPALDLLSKHGARLPAATTLDLIPPTLPVKDLESYFFGRIRNANSLLNEERIVAQLRGVEKVAVESAVLLGPESRRDMYGIVRFAIRGLVGVRFVSFQTIVWCIRDV